MLTISALELLLKDSEWASTNAVLIAKVKAKVAEREKTAVNKPETLGDIAERHAYKQVYDELFMFARSFKQSHDSIWQAKYTGGNTYLNCIDRKVPITDLQFKVMDDIIAEGLAPTPAQVGVGTVAYVMRIVFKNADEHLAFLNRWRADLDTRLHTLETALSGKPTWNREFLATTANKPWWKLW